MVRLLFVRVCVCRVLSGVCDSECLGIRIRFGPFGYDF